MPASETPVVSLGAWIVAFPVVYTMATVAVVAALAVFIDWAAGTIQRTRLSSRATHTQPAGSEA